MNFGWFSLADFGRVRCFYLAYVCCLLFNDLSSFAEAVLFGLIIDSGYFKDHVRAFLEVRLGMGRIGACGRPGKFVATWFRFGIVYLVHPRWMGRAGKAEFHEIHSDSLTLLV